MDAQIGLERDIKARIEAKLYMIVDDSRWICQVDKIRGPTTGMPTFRNFSGVDYYRCVHVVSFGENFCCVDGKMLEQAKTLGQIQIKPALLNALTACFGGFELKGNVEPKNKRFKLNLFFSNRLQHPANEPAWVWLTEYETKNQTMMAVYFPSGYRQVGICLKPKHLRTNGRLVFTPKKIQTKQNPYSHEFVKALIDKDIYLFSLGASITFFNDPTPENVRTFGDLCLLTQAQAGWRLSRPAPPLDLNNDPYIQTNPYENLHDITSSLILLLQPMIGFKTLLENLHIQPLIGDESSYSNQFWRLFIKFAEDPKYC